MAFRCGRELGGGLAYLSGGASWFASISPDRLDRLDRLLGVGAIAGHVDRRASRQKPDLRRDVGDMCVRSENVGWRYFLIWVGWIAMVMSFSASSASPLTSLPNK